MRSFFTITILALLFLASCMGYKEFPVESDYSYEGDFRRYKSFNFLDTRLLVSYKIFYDSLLFTGYDQPDLEMFIEYEESIDQEMDPIKYNLRQGTLLVLIYDRERKKSIWQGYASGVFGNQFFNDKRYLQGAVRSIFDQYKVFAEGFVVEKKRMR